jgi:transmembrane sensor
MATDASSVSSDLPDELLRVASDWFARLNGGDATAEDFALHDAWLRKRPEHRVAYAFVVETCALGAESRSVALPRASPTVSQQPIQQRRGTWFARHYLALSVTAGLVGVALALAMLLDGDLHTTQYRTAIGEVRTIVLNDGSIVVLNAASHIAVRYTGSVRSIEIFRGEALFTVAKNPARPFRVNVDDCVVQATGTAFDIDRHGPAVDVAVSEGTVAVYGSNKAAPGSSGAPSGSAVAVSKGFGVGYIIGRALAAPHVIALEQVGAWRNGWLSYERMPLARLVDDLNRHFEGTISIDNDELASMPISLTLRLHDRDTTLRTLERLLPIRVVQKGPKTALLVPSNHP